MRVNRLRWIGRILRKDEIETVRVVKKMHLELKRGLENK